jgi:hypothetical protein
MSKKSIIIILVVVVVLALILILATRINQEVETPEIIDEEEMITEPEFDIDFGPQFEENLEEPVVDEVDIEDSGETVEEIEAE